MSPNTVNYLTYRWLAYSYTYSLYSLAYKWYYTYLSGYSTGKYTRKVDPTPGLLRALR
jgi:hypothetical protein